MNIKNTCPKCSKQLTIDRTDYFITTACEHCLEFWEIVDYDDCCKNPELVTSRLIDEAGRSHVRKQCKSCGDITNQSLPGFTSEQKSLLPIADKAKREIYSTNKWNLYKVFCDARRAIFNTRRESKETIWWQEYNRYRQTDKWKEKRKLVLERDKYLCQACLKRDAVEVHHTTYEMVGNEPLFQLVSVCKPCHEHFHKLKDLKRAS